MRLDRGTVTYWCLLISGFVCSGSLLLAYTRGRTIGDLRNCILRRVVFCVALDPKDVLVIEKMIEPSSRFELVI